MKRLLFACLAIFLSSSAMAKSSTAVESAMDWLEVIDAGQYDKSWQQTSEFFRSQLSSTQWQQVLNKVRRPLGTVSSRTLLSTKQYHSLPRMPDGEYLVVTLSTSFSEKPTAVETITLSKTKQQWQAVGYFIK